MDMQTIKARLNLEAVLQNFEDLPALDAEARNICKDWNITIQFRVSGGLAASLEFKNGTCKHSVGLHPKPDVVLFFFSPKQLNNMFDDKGGTPLPLKGFTRLGFMQREFPRITARLTALLKPAPGATADPAFEKTSAILMLNTAVFAAAILAECDSTCKTVAAHTPKGILEVAASEDAPRLQLEYAKGGVLARKGAAKDAMARMTFRDYGVAHGLLTNTLDAFKAVGAGEVKLWGKIPIIDNTNLILDRVNQYVA